MLAINSDYCAPQSNKHSFNLRSHAFSTPGTTAKTHSSQTATFTCRWMDSSAWNGGEKEECSPFKRGLHLKGTVTGCEAGSAAPDRSIKNYLLNLLGRRCIFPQMFPVTLEGKNVSQVPLKNGSSKPGARCSGIQRPQAQIYTQHRREGSAHKVCTEV